MIKLLIKLFIKNSDNTKDNNVREKYSLLCGILGIICNFFLFMIKFIIGIVSGSIAITSDAFNNFSDVGTSVISIIGAKLSNAHADKEHPFGHGRIEYISSLIVSFIIILVGFELFKSAISKIINPEAIEISIPLIILLLLSILIKVWMFLYNRYAGRIINSKVLLATSQDSLNDVITTGAVVITTFIGMYIPFSIDGYVGALVSLFIMYSGFLISKDTISTLLGSPPDTETVKSIEEIIIKNENIIGIHDLIVHDYGPGRIMASVHAEVNETCNLSEIHDTIDFIENYIEDNLGIHIVIHIDPIASDCERLKEIKDFLATTLFDIDSELSFHDLRITDGENNINIMFDLCIPVSYKEYQRETILNRLKHEMSKRDERFNLIIKIDNKF